MIKIGVCGSQWVLAGIYSLSRFSPYYDICGWNGNQFDESTKLTIIQNTPAIPGLSSEMNYVNITEYIQNIYLISNALFPFSKNSTQCSGI